MALENQRYGRNKSTLVDSSYIDSGEYRHKFDSISDNEEVNKTLYQCAKAALKHRSGTKLEDMYWIDGDTGKVIASALDEQEEGSIACTASIMRKIKNTRNLVAIHTHPESMPPSAGDFNACFKYKYKVGYVAAHDGKVFGYTANEKIDERLYSAYIEKYEKEGNSMFDAQMNALKEIMRNSDIELWEV